MANENKDSLRWEQDGMSWLGFTDGAVFCHVFYTFGNSWGVQNHFAVDESKEFDDGFATAELAKGFGEKLYQEWLEEVEAHVEELELELDDEFLLSLLGDEDFEPGGLFEQVFGSLEDDE